MKGKIIVFGLVFLWVHINSAQDSRLDKEYVFAEKLYEDGMFLLAAEQFEQIATRAPNSDNADNAWYLAGEAYFKTSNFQKAFEAFKELEVGYPQSRHLTAARFRLAESQLQLGNFVTAAKLFKRVAQFHPESDYAPQALLAAGHAYKRAEEWSSAIAVFHDLIGTFIDSPERMEGHLEIVRSYLHLNKYNDAIAQIDAILRIYGEDPSDPRVTLLRAEIFEKMGQFDKAINLYANVSKKFSNRKESQQALYRLGALSEKKGDLDAALTYYQKYVSGESPGYKNEAYLRMGDIATQRGEYEDALEYFQKVEVAERDPLRTERDYKIGRTMYLLQRYFVAETSLKDIIFNTDNRDVSSHDSTFFEMAHHTLVDVQVALEHYHDALATIAVSKKRFPDSEMTSTLYFRDAEIADAYLADYTRALRSYQIFIEQFPRNEHVDAATFALGRCYENLDQYDLALREYQKYLRVYPGGDHYETVSDRIELIRETINLGHDNGVQRISTLFGKYVDGIPDKNWNLDLAKVYFEIKQFDQAITQLKQVLATTPPEERDRTELLFYLGNCYYGIGRKARLKDKNADAAAAFDSAAISLKFVKNQPEAEKRAEAAYLLARIALTDGLQQDSLMHLYSDWQKNHPDNPHFDFLLISLVRSFQNKFAAGDSDAMRKSLDYSERLIKDYSESEFSEEATFRKAAALYHLQSDSIALSELQRFAQTYPKSHFLPEVLLLQAQLEKKLGSIENAVRILRRIKSEYFYSRFADQASMKLGQLYLERGEYRSALDIFEHMSITGRKPTVATNGIRGNGVVHFNKARAYEGLGIEHEALRNYVDFLTTTPNSDKRVDAMMAIARIAQQQKNFHFAEEYYREALRDAASTEQQFDAHLALGDLLYEKEEYATARAEYLSATALAEMSSEQRYPQSRAIRCLYKQKKFAAADAEVREFKKRFDDTKMEEGQFLLDKANAFVDEKRFELAEEAFKDLRGDFKNTDLGAKGEFGLGKVYLITNHTEEALEILTKLPEKYPNSETTALTYLNLGDFYYKSGQVENAISAFKQVMRHPKSESYRERALRYLIQCYRDVGFWDQAIVKTREYLELFPYSGESFRRKIDLAFFLMKLKEYDRAIRNFRELLALADSETEAEIQFYIAQCYNEMGNFERATAEYLKVKYLTAPSKLPWHVTALFEAGRCLLRLDQTEHAKRIFQQIVREQGAQSNFGRFAQQKLDELSQGAQQF